MTPGRRTGPLTTRELEIAGHVARGLRSRQIAALLDISVRTVENHLRAAYAKTGTGSRVQFVNWLARNDPAPEEAAGTR